MFKILPLLVLHVLSHLVAVLLLHTYSRSLPVPHTMVLKYLRVSAMLYYYRLADGVSCMYAGVGVLNHWEALVQQMLGEYLILMQYPAVVLVLVLSAVVGAALRYRVLLYLARVEATAGREAVTAGWVHAVADGIDALANLLGLAG